MKLKLGFLITILTPACCFAQNTTKLRGNVVSSIDKTPVAGVVVILKDQGLRTVTDSNGSFSFEAVVPGKELLLLNGTEINPKDVVVDLEDGVMNEVQNIMLTRTQLDPDLSLIGTVDDAFIDDDASLSAQEINSTMVLSNDVYLNRAAYQLSPMRFRVRGYKSHYEQKMINGVVMNDQLRGVFNHASLGALNDMTRNGDRVHYLSPSEFAYGSLGGVENLNMHASDYAKGNKATLTYTNRNYYLRAMASYASGLLDNGWAFASSVGMRYSHEGATDGTFYRNLAFAFAAEKQWNEGEHSLSLITYVSPVERGQQGLSYQEVYELVGDYQYNPNWGYQNGKKRNAKVVTAFDPTAIFSYTWKINEKTTWTTGLGSHYGRYGNTALNWYNAADPRPDYYRYLPSYFTDPRQQEEYELIWRRNDTRYTQINWDELYLANALQQDGKALYMVEERRSDLFETNLNSTLNTKISDNFNITAGIGVRYSLSQQFKTVNDLLGADYLLDVDKFAEQDFQGDTDKMQNDLNRPHRNVFEGGIFGYHYNMHIGSANAWVLNEGKTHWLDYYYGFRYTYTAFEREGKMRNGRYPTSSYGRGTRHEFNDVALKAGGTVKFNARHFLTGNISYGTEAPLPNDAYVSPRISDKEAFNLKSGRVFSADINYIFSLPRIQGRVSLFRTNFYDQIERSSYYDGTLNTFINHTLSNVDRVHHGAELGITYKLNNSWSFDLAGTIAEYYYNNNPMGVINSENGKIEDQLEQVYMKNLYVGGVPQFAGTFGVRYFIDYWFLGANLNGFGRNHIEVAPLRRLASNYATVDPSIPEQLEAYMKLTSQERFEDHFTVDLSIGKIIYLPNRSSLNFNLSVNNVLNTRNIRIGGFEQGRMDLSYPDRFNSKYTYMQGINCFLNTSYRF